MSSVQKELYKSIISQNSDLMKAITTRVEKGQQQLKTPGLKLQNILMQLRKCLAHPFIQSPDLEDGSVDPQQEQRALIEASGKLSILAKILPKLKERGHRILIFSQFLDMLDLLEDFLTAIGFRYGRLDGSTSTVNRQHMIDEFNLAESKLDCFLLSTRAGGAGINLGSSLFVWLMSYRGYRDCLRSGSQPTSGYASNCKSSSNWAGKEGSCIQTHDKEYCGGYIEFRHC
jgi:chromodomain-helicase-DNA-binding protein 4